MFKVLFLVSFYLVCSHSYFIVFNETLNNLLSQFQNLRDNLSIHRNGVELLKRQTNALKEVLPEKEERSVYLGNLPNSFSLVKRLTKVWPILVSQTRSLSGYAMKPVHLVLNNTDLWRSAVTGLIRLQETYNIPTETIADGQLEAAYRNTHLTAEDCFDIGVFYFRVLRHSSRAIEWFKSALMRAKEGTTFSSAIIMKYLYLSQCFIGDSKSASLTLMTILENNPSFFSSAEFRDEYAYIANSTCSEIARKFEKSLYDKFEDVHNVKSQRGLCQMKNHQPSIANRLKCRLIDYHQSHLRIRPFKMEELHLDPPLLRFYSVIYDQEIEELKTIHYNKSRPAVVDYLDADEYHDTQNNVWLYTNYDVYDLLGKLNHRSKEITNLDLFRSESLMLASYGIAGEIKLHDDLGPKEDILNPIYSRADYATLLFYLNNVPDGGLTIFPLLNVSVVPSKGDAILFLNRQPDWGRNVQMLHSGCPILRGDKWILTKWFHVIGQDFPKCVSGKETSFKHYYL